MKRLSIHIKRCRKENHTETSIESCQLCKQVCTGAHWNILETIPLGHTDFALQKSACFSGSASCATEKRVLGGIVSNLYQCVKVYRRTVRFDFSLLHCVATMLNGVTCNHAVSHIVESLKSE